MFLVVVFVFGIWFGFLKLASHYVSFYVCPTEFLKNGGVKNVDSNTKISKVIFSVFPPMLCPAAKDFLKDQKNDEGLRALTLSCLPFLPEKYRPCALEIETEYLNSPDTSDRPIAAQAFGSMGQDAVPQLIQAWKSKNDRFFKMVVAHSLLRVGDKKFIPVLENDVKSDTVEGVLASIVLYEMTSGEEYKDRIYEILKNGSLDNRGLAIVFMGGVGDGKMIPLLKQALKDRDGKLRAAAKKNIDAIKKNLENKPQVAPVVPEKLR